MDDAFPDGLLWHYTDGPGLLSILASRVLWATASGYLNDAEEVELGRRRLVRRFTELADSRDPLFLAIRDRLEGQGPQERPSTSWFFILSASQSPDSLAMWRSYGGRGESYAVGLDPSAPLGVLVPDGAAADDLLIHQRGWTPVRYDAAGQDELVDGVYAEFATELRQILDLRSRGDVTTREYLAGLPKTLEAAEQALVLIKHEGFREEQETRHSTVILGDAGAAVAATRIIRFRHGPYGMTPYLTLTGGTGRGAAPVTTRPAPLPIRAVAVSPTPNGDAAVQSVAALLASHGLSRVSVHRSRIPFRA